MELDLLLLNGYVVTSEGTIGPDIGIGIHDGKITSIGVPENLAPADCTVDLDKNFLLPGVIDCHVHTRSPGYEYKEDWTTATEAAAAGGVTTLLAMPNTDPIVSTPERLQQTFDIANSDAIVDFQQYAVLTSENLDQVKPLAEAGAAGYKVFLGTTFGEIDPPNDGELHDAMGTIAETGKRIGFHEENDEILSYYADQFKEEGRNQPIDHARSRPIVTEAEAVQRIILFSEDTNCPVHMFHLSQGTGAEIVADAKQRGVDVTAETMPHYLWFTEEVLEEKGNIARVQPPIRNATERDLLWQAGVHGDGIDCIATDHAPHSDEEKGLNDPFRNTWESISGFVGLEAEVPSMLTFVNEGRLSIEQWVFLHSTRPAQIWGLYPEKGSLQIGTDADFTVVDLDHEWTFDCMDQHSKSHATPFHEETFVGKPTMTFVRGAVVYDGGEVIADPGYGEKVETGSTSGP